MNQVFGRRSPRGRTIMIVAVVALILIVGAEAVYLVRRHSGNGSSSAPTTTAQPSQTTTSLTPAGSTGGSEPATPFPTYSNNVKLRADVATTSCQASSGGWTAAGTIDNTQTTSHDFRLTVYFTDAQATVLSGAQTSVTVNAGATEHWTVTGRFSAPSRVVCVLVGVQ